MPENVTSQLLQGFWYKLKKINPQTVVISPAVATKSHKQQDVILKQHHLRLAVAEHQILGAKHFLLLGQKQEHLVVEESTISPEK